VENRAYVLPEISEIVTEPVREGAVIGMAYLISYRVLGLRGDTQSVKKTVSECRARA
jgi:hypothetical protein